MSSLVPDATLLGLLAAQPQHGYQLLEHFRDPALLGLVWNMSTSQVYAVLKRLENQAWICGQRVTTENAPARIEYSLTVSGMAYFQGWLDEPMPSASIRCVRVEFLSRLYVARLLNLPTHEIVLRQKQACQHELALLTDQRQQIAYGVAFLSNELVIAQLETVVHWIDRCEMVSRPE